MTHHVHILRAWFLLFRPWSYTATLVPFLVAAGLLAGRLPGLDWVHWALGLVAGFFFQATVNLLNTWGDERSGVDNVPGAIRTTPQVHEGLVSMRALFAVAVACAAAAALIGVATCFRRTPAWRINLPLLAAGFVGFLGATNYSTGLRFKYHGLGVPFVSFLMGPLEIFVAVALLAPDLARNALTGHFAFGPAVRAILLTLPIAALVGVIMHGNDMRDIPTDRAAGIITFASWLGPRGALAYYFVCHLLPYGIAFGLAFGGGRGAPALPAYALVLVCLPLTVRTLRRAWRTYLAFPADPPWRRLERASGGIHFVFGLLYALALLGR